MKTGVKLLYLLAKGSLRIIVKNYIRLAALDIVVLSIFSIKITTKKPTQWAGSICIVQLDYALPSEPNTSIRSSTASVIASKPGFKNLRGSKSFFLSYSASFASYSATNLRVAFAKAI